MTQPRIVKPASKLYEATYGPSFDHARLLGLAANRKRRKQPNSSPNTILRYFRPSKTLGAKKYVEKRLLELISRGAIEVGDQLASAPKIAKQITKSTRGVADAIAELRDWGLFETRGNLGTFCVRTTKLEKRLKRPKRTSRIIDSMDDWH